MPVRRGRRTVQARRLRFPEPLGDAAQSKNDSAGHTIDCRCERAHPGRVGASPAYFGTLAEVLMIKSRSVKASRFHNLSTKVRFGETPKPMPEAGTQLTVHSMIRSCAVREICLGAFSVRYCGAAN